MSMFDNVTCELAMPDSRRIVDNLFQTQSLWRCMYHFSITTAGHLILHNRKCPSAKQERAGGRDDLRAQTLSNIDLKYHGDIEIHGRDAGGALHSYAVRFTHGVVEWIRPSDSLTQLHQAWLVERG